MFDTTPLVLDGIHQDGNIVRGDHIFHETANLNTESTWNLNQHQVQAFPPSTSFTAGMDTNYLPPLVENMETMVPNMVEVQSCSMDEEGEMTLESLQRQQQELNEWVESQQCSNFLFWDNIEGVQLNGGEANIAPTSSSMGTSLSSFPSSL
ncbi:hypothetical protein COLO4_08370 [Corchorus olitorius]|uniref:Uncharacterized protein n=1 Tax=Corchorus olitorius TaxID=93759 RepID=A0A1R3KG53_9ROSI|nr:hypothetical protein COLO4_08370 [Corchorus olitorius]